MSLDSVEGLVLALFLILPGAAAGTAMRYWTGYPQETGSLEPLVKSVGRSLVGLLVAEAANSLLTDATFGEFLLEPLTLLGPGSVVGGHLVANYAILVALTVGLFVGIRMALMTQPGELMAGKRTLVVPPIYELRRHLPPEVGPDSPKDATDDAEPQKKRWWSRRRPAPFVRAILDTGAADVEGYLIWSSDGTEADSAIIIRDKDTRGVTLVPMARITALHVIDLRYSDPSSDE